MTLNLFHSLGDIESRQERLGPGAMVPRQFAAAKKTALVPALREVEAGALFRHVITPGVAKSAK